MPEYSAFEMIAFTGSRQLEDRKIVFVGTGLPIIAAMHAQLTHAPNLYMIYEAGSLAPILEIGMPLSVGDTRAGHKACFLKGLCAVFELAQRGFADYAFIGGSYYNKPDIRFPGSGGAGAMAANCGKTIAIMALEKRRFARQVDFITSIGYGDGSPDYREKAGVMGSGPYRVITQQALFGFDEKTKRMKLLEVRPGFTVQQIQEMVEFELIIPPNVPEMAEPTEEDLHLLRDVIDAEGYFLKRVVKK